jgi:hypothetical protein
VLGGGPLHRRADGHAAGDVEVLPHADLLAVEQHRRAGQREQQAVDHAHAARVAAEHRRQAPAQAPAVDLHVLVRTERAKTSSRSSSLSLSRVSSSWLRTNVAHWLWRETAGREVSASASGAAS